MTLHCASPLRSGPKVIQLRIQFAKLLYSTMKLAMPSHRRSHTIAGGGVGIGRSFLNPTPPARRASTALGTSPELDLSSPRSRSLPHLPSARFTADTGGGESSEHPLRRGPTPRHFRSSSMVMPHEAAAHFNLQQQQQPPAPEQPQQRLERADLTAAYLSANPDHRESIEFLRVAIQHPETSSLIQRLLEQSPRASTSMGAAAAGDTATAPGKAGSAGATASEMQGNRCRMWQLLRADQPDRMAYPLWMPICDMPCACFDNPERASVILLQNLTGHRHVNRFCAGGFGLKRLLIPTIVSTLPIGRIHQFVRFCIFFMFKKMFVLAPAMNGAEPPTMARLLNWSDASFHHRQAIPKLFRKASNAFGNEQIH